MRRTALPPAAALPCSARRYSPCTARRKWAIDALLKSDPPADAEGADRGAQRHARRRAAAIRVAITLNR